MRVANKCKRQKLVIVLLRVKYGGGGIGYDRWQFPNSLENAGIKRGLEELLEGATELSTKLKSCYRFGQGLGILFYTDNYI